MLVGAGFGGTAAAPIARQVLQSRALSASEARERALGADALQVLAPDAVVGELLLRAQRRLDRVALGANSASETVASTRG